MTPYCKEPIFNIYSVSVEVDIGRISTEQQMHYPPKFSQTTVLTMRRSTQVAQMVGQIQL